MKANFIAKFAFDQKWEGLKSWKDLDFKKWGGAGA